MTKMTKNPLSSAVKWRCRISKRQTLGIGLIGVKMFIHGGGNAGGGGGRINIKQSSNPKRGALKKEKEPSIVSGKSKRRNMPANKLSSKEQNPRNRGRGEEGGKSSARNRPGRVDLGKEQAARVRGRGGREKMFTWWGQQKSEVGQVR